MNLTLVMLLALSVVANADDCDNVCGGSSYVCDKQESPGLCIVSCMGNCNGAAWSGGQLQCSGYACQSPTAPPTPFPTPFPTQPNPQPQPQSNQMLTGKIYPTINCWGTPSDVFSVRSDGSCQFGQSKEGAGYGRYTCTEGGTKWTQQPCTNGACDQCDEVATLDSGFCYPFTDGTGSAMVTCSGGGSGGGSGTSGSCPIGKIGSTCLLWALIIPVVVVVLSTIAYCTCRNWNGPKHQSPQKPLLSHQYQHQEAYAANPTQVPPSQAVTVLSNGPPQP